MPSGLLGFCLLQTHVRVASYLGWSQRPLSPQENTVLQTCGVAGAALSQFIQVFLSESFRIAVHDQVLLELQLQSIIIREVVRDQ